MKIHDFYIGLEFVASAGFLFRCTDVGQRTITAIRLDKEDPSWYSGPPYAVEEIVFDEHDLPSCHLTDDDAIMDAIESIHTSAHPNFPHEDVVRMFECKWELPDMENYSNQKLLRIDRCRADGEVFHPYAAKKQGDDWVVLCYLLFPRTYLEIDEAEFLRWPLATEADLVRRAKTFNQP